MIYNLKIYSVVLILLTFFIKVSYAQTKSFSNDPEKFLKEIDEYLSNSNKIRAKELIDEFKVYWEEEKLFTDEQEKKIITTANRLLDRKCRPSPHFFNYIETLVFYGRNKIEETYFDDWNKALNVILKQSKPKLSDIEKIIDIGLNLFKENALFINSTVQWKCSNNNYQFVFKADKVFIMYKKTNLVCISKRDSIKIYDTEGIYDPLTYFWKGVNGKVTWFKAALPENKVYAYLSKYNIDMRKSEYQADSVTFINTEFFDKPLLGELKDKVVVTGDTSKSSFKTSYPQFDSYEKRFQLKNIYENIDYDGGFSMKGNQFIGSGDENKDAYLYLYYEDSILMKIASKMYIFYENRIISDPASATIYLKKDSIYHPGLTFKYMVDSAVVTLFRQEDDISRSVFFDTYHGLELNVRQMVWKMKEPLIRLQDIKSTSGLNQATFESVDYFRQERYFEIQGMDEQNPLVVLRNFSKRYNTKEFTTKQIADFLPASIPATHQFLLNLAYRGFIAYDINNERGIILPKLENYILNSIGKRDYDVISFESKTENTENAQLSLLNHNLLIKGVPEIFLSDSQNVAIFPRDQEIVVKKNRNFEFHGKIRAGYFLFAGSNFKFDYNKFKIELTDVDYVRMRVPSHMVDKNGMPIHVFIKNKLENIKGSLEIDDPNNKSGVNPHPEYPIFNSIKDAFVYYDGKDIMDGVYDRNRFYFQIYPFSMDSLDNMRVKHIQFPGYFVSAGIFPPFEDTLVVMYDYSLGFIRKSPPEGYPMYGGKATYNNDIILSNNGLRGNGELKYLTSTITSEDFQFFPDSMNTNAKYFDVTEQKTGIEYPPLHGENINIHWLPEKDELYAKDTENPMKMYNDNAELHGVAKLTPSGLYGKGRLEFEKAQLFSDEFRFKTQTVDADTANFNLKDIDMTDFSFKTQNVKAHLDFKNRLGEFKSNGEASFVEFPQNQYICYMDQFTWYMDKEEIEMSASKKALEDIKDTTQLSPTELEDIQLEGSQFISIHPKQDSLKFVAPSAKYNLRNKIITANDVKFIRVADATVYPSDGKVVIEKKAKMQTLLNSKIITNITTRYHTIYNANTNIYGKKDYTSSGDYDYIDETGQKEVIHFDVVAVDSTLQTYATGKIGITDSFLLSPYYEYTGNVKLLASQQFLYFDGSVRMKHLCEKIKPLYVNFEAQIDPKEIYIPIENNIVDINNNQLHASFMITNDSAHIYPAFLNKHENYSDIEMTPARGYLYFDKSSGKYKIADKEKLIEYNMPGNYLSIHRTACNMYSEGKINLGTDFGQVKYTSAGSINSDMLSDDYNIDLILALNFFFNDKCLDIMAQTINTIATEPIDFDREIYQKSLMELVGKDAANEFIANLSLGSFKKFPSELEQSIVFSDLKLEYNNITHTYNSLGQIGISNILKNQIQKYVDGHIEIVKKRSGDILTIYLELDESNYFYFSYRNGVMRAVSSNEEFNTLIKEMKPDDRKIKTEKGETPYVYYPVSPNIAKKFKKKFEEPDENENPDEQNETNEEELNDEDF